MKEILAVIPARKNSKGILQKNKVVINEVPSIFHTILNAKRVNLIDDGVVTSDDDEIISFAKYFEIF